MLYNTTEYHLLLKIEKNLKMLMWQVIACEKKIVTDLLKPGSNGLAPSCTADMICICTASRPFNIHHTATDDWSSILSKTERWLCVLHHCLQGQSQGHSTSKPQIYCTACVYVFKSKLRTYFILQFLGMVECILYVYDLCVCVSLVSGWNVIV